jgi:hypothetical protein
LSCFAGSILSLVADGVGGNIGSGIGRLHNFILSSSLINHWLKGSVGVVVLWWL